MQKLNAPATGLRANFYLRLSLRNITPSPSINIIPAVSCASLMS
jgi:hypothetical protein